MRNKYKLPTNDYYTVLSFIRGHRLRVQNYKRARADILNGSSNNFVDAKEDSVRVYLPSGGGKKISTTESKGLALAVLEESAETQKIRIVDRALEEATQTIESKALREKLQRALMNNIEDPRRFAWRNINLTGIGERKFFDCKHYFVYLVYQDIFKMSSEQ